MRFVVAGKTTLGKAIVDKLGHDEVDVDATKVALYGADIIDADLTREQWNNIYEHTDAQIVDLLKAGRDVVDASRNFARAEREHVRGIVNNLGCTTITIYVRTPEDIVRRRWQENRRNRLRRDVTDEDFEAIVRGIEPPTAEEHPVVFDTDEGIERWIARNIDILT